MTAATVTRRIATADPTSEVVVLTLSTGETFTSEKFGKVYAVAATPNTEGSAITASPTPYYNTSGAIITVDWGEASGDLVTLQIWGN